MLLGLPISKKATMLHKEYSQVLMVDQILLPLAMIRVVLVHLGLQMIGVAVALMVVVLQIVGKLKMKKNCYKKSLS